MSPLHRVHMTSYSSLVETVRYLVPFSRYSKLFVEICQLYPTPPAFGVSTEGDPVQTKRFLAIVWCHLRDPMCSRFDTILACDRQADGHTDRHMMTANNMLA